MICGLDEAGRGPVLGDLVVAGICCNEEDVKILKEIGVNDSKVLSPKKREKLFKILTRDYLFDIVSISPQQLDKLRLKYTLNVIEAIAFAKIIDRLKPSKAYIDCADPIPNNFKNAIEQNLQHECRLVIEHKADQKYPVVSAGSIIAKVTRDAKIKMLSQEYGSIGSGYPADPITREFLSKWIRKYRSYPPFVRKSWKTTSKTANLKIDDFFP
jgi:ribonuclease HII|tara:strand:+ start:2973 stop:3611 length:639 start_codon:yes stop_codon:yes gene_type:complete